MQNMSELFSLVFIYCLMLSILINALCPVCKTSPDHFCKFYVVEDETNKTSLDGIIGGFTLRYLDFYLLSLSFIVVVQNCED